MAPEMCSLRRDAGRARGKDAAKGRVKNIRAISDGGPPELWLVTAGRRGNVLNARRDPEISKLASRRRGEVSTNAKRIKIGGGR